MTAKAVKIDGPRVLPRGGSRPDRLVVLVHGYGADGNDLIGLAPHWQQFLPTAAFVAPNAPQRCDMSPMGYQWFPITKLDPKAMLAGVESAAATLAQFIDDELARHGLPADRLALVGFSQGTMMSLHVGLRRAVPPCGIVGYSGVLAGSEVLKEQMMGKPPVLLVHGDADQMIPVQALYASANALGEAGVRVRWHVSRGVGHSIDPEGLALGGQFLASAFAGEM